MFEEREATSAEQKSLERLSSGFGSTRASSRSSSDTGNVQVVGDCSNYQFVTTPAHAAEQNPTELYVAIAFDWPSPDQQSSYRAAYSLLGCACFQFNIPDHVRTLRIGVENPRGPEAVWMNVRELFTERMCFNFGLVPSQRRLVSRYVSLHGEVLRPRSSNYVMLMWDRHYFAVQLNGYNLGPIQLSVNTAPGPSSQGCPSFGRSVRSEYCSLRKPCK